MAGFGYAFFSTTPLWILLLLLLLVVLELLVFLDAVVRICFESCREGWRMKVSPVQHTLEMTHVHTAVTETKSVV